MPKRRASHNLLDRGLMLTPLIDIMFLVLIFFMVNNSPTQRSLGVQAPVMPNAPPIAPENKIERTLLLAVRADLSYTIQLQEKSRILKEWQNKKNYQNILSQTGQKRNIERDDISALSQMMEEQLNELERSQHIFTQVRRIRLRADQSLSYASVIAICNLLYRWGLPLDLDVRASHGASG